METDNSRKASAKKPWSLLFNFDLTRKITIICLLLLIVFVAAGQEHLYRVEYDGQVVGYCDDVRVFDGLVDEVVAECSAELGKEVCFDKSLLDIIRVDETAGKPMAESDLKSAIADCLPLYVEGAVIEIDGEPVVSLASTEEAEQTIQMVQDNYVSTYVHPDADLDSWSIKEEMTIAAVQMGIDELMSVEDAQKYLTTGTTETLKYTVKAGDSFWLISQNNNIPLSELMEANADVDPGVLREGMVLNMIVPKPFIHMLSEETVTTIENIPYAEEVRTDSDMWAWQSNVIQPGVYGEKEVVYHIVRENGVTVDKQIVSQQVISEPTTMIVVQGANRNTSSLAQGTGSFLWPTSGTITSYFGAYDANRSGAHTGVDIARSYGTYVYAADKGVVVKSSYYGAYGNAIVLDHGNGYSTLYGHLNGYAVSVGDVVEKGDLIGYMGSTGNSSGPHLHFEIRVNGRPTNPLSYF